MDIKQVIVINGGLKMSIGKTAAQAAHAAVGAAERASAKQRAQWAEFGVTKIVTIVADEDRLLALTAKAHEYRLPHFLVADAGRTEIEPGSLTALGIGPAEAALIDKITRSLPLL
jgi:peptidyl-tRNA hydrolase, PTH2 family